MSVLRLLRQNGCETNAKRGHGSHPAAVAPIRSSPARRAWVSRLIYDKAARKVTGVVYPTPAPARNEQPAGLVVLSAYVFGNISLMFHSGIGEPYDPVTGKGAVGKNYCYSSRAWA